MLIGINTYSRNATDDQALVDYIILLSDYRNNKKIAGSEECSPSGYCL